MYVALNVQNRTGTQWTSTSPDFPWSPGATVGRSWGSGQAALGQVKSGALLCSLLNEEPHNLKTGKGKKLQQLSGQVGEGWASLSPMCFPSNSCPDPGSSSFLYPLSLGALRLSTLSLRAGPLSEIKLRLRGLAQSFPDEAGHRFKREM